MSPPTLVAADRVEVDFDPVWSVRSVFGGAIAATAVRAARLALACELPLSEAFFSFLAPTAPGPATVVVRAHRASRRFVAADVVVESGGRESARGTLSFVAGAGGPAPSAEELARGRAPAPCDGAAFGGAVEWDAPADWTAPTPRASGCFVSRVRACGDVARMSVDEWACIAADILGPALVSEITPPFAIATATLSVQMAAYQAPDAWWTQRVRARLTDGLAFGDVELVGSDGALLARSRQSAAVGSASESEMPRIVTGFAA